MILNNENNLIPIPPPPYNNASKPKSVWGPWPSIGYSIVIMVVFFIAQGIVVAFPAVTAIVKHAGMSFDSAQDLSQYVMDQLNLRLGFYQSIATIVSGIAGIFMIWVFIRARKGSGFFEYLGVKKTRIRTMIFSIVTIVAAIVVADVVQNLLGGNATEPTMDKIYATSVWPWLLWVAVVVFAPLFEEALFRGFLFEGILQSWGVFAAIMLTAFTWSMLHSIQYNLGGVVYIFFLGLVLGLVRWKSGSIWTTMTMHAVVNLIAMIALSGNFNF